MSAMIDEIEDALTAMWGNYQLRPSVIYIASVRYVRRWKGRKFVYRDYPEPFLKEIRRQRRAA